MRIIFCGTPDFAVPALRRLIAEPDFDIAAVISQPDRPRGREAAITATPIKEVALAAGLHVFQPEKIRSDAAYDFIVRVQPDAVVIIAYGQIVPARLVDVPRLGWINLHGSLLPKYRGAAPIQWAIANGETRTGITTMRIDAGMDTGPLLLQQQMEIGRDETAPELSRRMADAGAALMLDSLRKYDRNEITPRPQDHSLATLAPIIKKDDGRIQWSQSAQQIYNRMRAFDPWPGVFTTFRGQTCRLWGRAAEIEHAAKSLRAGEILVSGEELLVACGNRSWLSVSAVQVAGRGRVSARDFLHGARVEPHASFAS